jgi:DNA-binding PadR family transcriptional regulator
VSKLENNPDAQVEKNIDAIYERFLKEFMDVIIMVKIREEGEASGYDLLSYFHGKFDLLVSPGTIYATLYSMERNNLVARATTFWSKNKKAATESIIN